MLRVLAIAVACTAGATATWMFIPTDPMASMGQMSFSSEPPEPAEEQQVRATTPMIEGKEREQRAEKLVGDDLKYLNGKDVRDVDWFLALGPKRIERAMDECALITSNFLYNAHSIAQHSDGGADFDPKKPLAIPSASDLRSCRNADKAYSQMHGETSFF